MLDFIRNWIIKRDETKSQNTKEVMDLVGEVYDLVCEDPEKRAFSVSVMAVTMVHFYVTNKDVEKTRRYFEETLKVRGSEQKVKQDG